MYTLSSKLKVFAGILFVVGLIMTVFGFINSPADLAEVEQMLEKEHHGDHHGASTVNFEDATNDHHNTHGEESHGDEAHGESHEMSHAEHVYHQLTNRPWSAVYVAAFFFFMIGLGVLAFYAIQKAAQAGWSPVLFRVMEGISSYILPGGIIMFILLLISAFHVNHIFIWMDEDVVAHDEIIQGKTGFLNIPFFLARAAAFLIGWNLYRWNIRKFSLKQDEAKDGDIAWYKKGFKHSAAFLVFFIVTESIMSWDWIMSFDPHWFSTLFGWYVFASMFVSGITTIALVTIYLKSKGYLEFVNDSHIHDLAKFMFGVSIFWTYLWFSQFMLIWYSNIPEEVTYYVTRIEDYNLVFFGMVAINFLFPLLILMNSDFKRINWFVVTAGLFILVGHYLDIYVMVMPATVGASWFIGLPEIGSFLMFGGIFLFYVFNTISKAPLLAKGDPYLKESKHFHY
ncbi:quinol:cytochrome C oxidoreductase [Nonlabens tegetincola]|uniref:quinol:cytochrome C oxidoreductase n=1 Tax=Nonlabens tegetincola TaxID=323273 RepID=UPI000A20B9BA|nr:quinol:cytochrome C oxidoreductase [Nonlabens tegetincola]ARN71964.1 quinol:cytochrome C oxidoreductase [Nonlabens tegetincola]